MSEFDFDMDVSSTVGFSVEDKKKVLSNKLEYWKAKKGETYRCAIVNFQQMDVAAFKRALQAKPDMTREEKEQLVAKIRAKMAEKYGTPFEKLTPVQLLDINEPFLKSNDCIYHQGGLNYVALDGIPQEDVNFFKSVKGAEFKRYFTTLLLFYPLDEEGEVDMDALAKGKWKILPFRMSDKKYEIFYKISRAQKESGLSLGSIDLTVTCKEENYQQLEVVPAGPAVYLKDPALKQKVLEKATSKELVASLTAFQKRTVEWAREKLGMAPAPRAPGDSGVNVEDVLNNI